MLAEPTTTISVTKLHPAIGAEIRGVDLSRPLDAEDATTSIWLLRSGQTDSPLVCAFCKLISKRRAA